MNNGYSMNFDNVADHYEKWYKSYPGDIYSRVEKEILEKFLPKAEPERNSWRSDAEPVIFQNYSPNWALKSLDLIFPWEC